MEALIGIYLVVGVLGILISYWVIRLAVRHALADAREAGQSAARVGEGGAAGGGGQHA